MYDEWRDGLFLGTQCDPALALAAVGPPLVRAALKELKAREAEPVSWYLNTALPGIYEGGCHPALRYLTLHGMHIYIFAHI